MNISWKVDLSAGLWIEPVKDRALARDITLYVLGQDASLSQCLSLPRCINGYWLTLNGLKSYQGGGKGVEIPLLA